MTTHEMSRVALVEALHKLDDIEQHPAVGAYLAAAVADEAEALELILTLPTTIEDIVRREQVIGELRMARNAKNWISDWKTAAINAIRDYDNNNQPPTTHEST